MGKVTIDEPFSIAMSNYQMVNGMVVVEQPDGIRCCGPLWCYGSLPVVLQFNRIGRLPHSPSPLKKHLLSPKQSEKTHPIWSMNQWKKNYAQRRIGKDGEGPTILEPFLEPLGDTNTAVQIPATSRTCTGDGMLRLGGTFSKLLESLRDLFLASELRIWVLVFWWKGFDVIGFTS